MITATLSPIASSALSVAATAPSTTPVGECATRELNPNLPVVLLMGDSIRRGYDDIVIDKLKGEANVVFHEDNGRYGPYTLREMDRWKAELKLEKADIVHWNFGLWDILHLNAGGTSAADDEAISTYSPVVGSKQTYEKDPLVPPEFYAYYVRRVRARISELYPKSKQIFATTTPVLEERASWAYRSNAEVELYNKLAREALPGVAVDDLWAVVKQSDMFALHGKDWVHFTQEGYEILAESVARSIREVLRGC